MRSLAKSGSERKRSLLTNQTITVRWRKEHLLQKGRWAGQAGGRWLVLRAQGGCRGRRVPQAAAVWAGAGPLGPPHLWHQQQARSWGAGILCSFGCWSRRKR